MEAEPLARRQPDHPHPHALVLGNEHAADTRIVVLLLALELGCKAGRPSRHVGAVARLFQHRQGHCFLPRILDSANKPLALPAQVRPAA